MIKTFESFNKTVEILIKTSIEHENLGDLVIDEQHIRNLAKKLGIEYMKVYMVLGLLMK